MIARTYATLRGVFRGRQVIRGVIPAAAIHIAKPKKKLTTEQKAAKKKRQQEYMTVFMNGKQKRIKRPPTIEGVDADEFILRNADPIWLHQNELWEYIDQIDEEELEDVPIDDDSIPF